MRKEFTLNQFASLVASINTEQNLDSLLNRIIALTKDALDCEGCSLLLYNKEEDCLEFHVSQGNKSERLISLKVPKGQGLAGYIMKTLEPVLVNDAQLDERLYKAIDETVGFQTRNLIGVPMLARGNFIGVLEAVNTNDKRDFEQKDIELLQHISEISAIAIHNRFLYNELEERFYEINALLKISQSLSQVRDLSEFLNACGEAISEFLGISRISFITQSSQGKWKIRYAKGIPFSEQEIVIDGSSRILSQVISGKKPILVENIKKEELEKFPFHENYKTKSFISFPVIWNDHIVGILNLTDKWNQKSFTKNDLKIIKIITNYMLEVYQTLMAKLENERYQQLQRDLDTARKFQLYSLSKIPSRIEDMEIAIYYESCNEIGGDFYDIVYNKNGVHTFSIGDVSGKGITSALFMELAKTVLHNEISRNQSLKLAILNAHRILQEALDKKMMVEVMSVQVNSKKRIFNYVSAGHNRQFYYNAKEKNLELLRGRGIPLGSKLSIVEFEEKSIPYNSGDILLLYTDGITEERNKHGEIFGEERLINLFLKNILKQPKEILSTLLEEAEHFRGYQKISDDYSLLLIKFL